MGQQRCEEDRACFIMAPFPPPPAPPCRFVLTGAELSYFTTQPVPGVAPEARGILDLRQYTLERAEAVPGRSSLCMRLVARRSESELFFYAESEADFVAWVKAIAGVMRALEDLDAAEADLAARTEEELADRE